MDERKNIKECPFCGGYSNLHASFNRRISAYFVCVKCEICGAECKAFVQKENPVLESWDGVACNNAIHAWNMRYAGANNTID